MLMRSWMKVSYAAALGMTLAGAAACAHGQKTDDDFGKGVPAESPLAKVKFDMTMSDVIAILGEPNGTNNYLGGKAFNPFNYGGDSGVMLETHYKGLGRVVYNVERYSHEKKVDKVEYDPNDPGHQ